MGEVEQFTVGGMAALLETQVVQDLLKSVRGSWPLSLPVVSRVLPRGRAVVWWWVAFGSAGWWWVVVGGRVVGSDERWWEVVGNGGRWVVVGDGGWWWVVVGGGGGVCWGVGGWLAR